MEAITEKMKIHEQWYEEAKGMTLDKLSEFLDRILNKYHHDYGTICHAIASGAVATAHAMDNSPQGGITGFQAGAVMWQFIRQWNYEDNKCGLKIIDYDKFLYPQYNNDFRKTISKPIWENLQKEALKSIGEAGTGVAAPYAVVLKHWENIVAGVVPFGYKVEAD